MDVRSARRRNLEELVKSLGSIAALARASGLSEKYLSQIINQFQGKRDRTPRQLGDRAARQIESGLGKPHGWMDVHHAEEVGAQMPPPDTPEMTASMRGHTRAPTPHNNPDDINHGVIEENPFNIPRWPFGPALLQRYDALSEYDKGVVAGRLQAAIEECERENGDDAGQRKA